MLASTIKRGLVVLLLVCVCPRPAGSYSVLTHEQVVDLLWKDQIQPLLLKRFPGATEDDLRKAHAYAYGGCVLQDMGYYPFGNKYFSDLVHYVRSGDFVEALLRDSSDLNEYAFALGALSHYASDNSGHPTINRVVAIEFPKLKKKYGTEVTYADDPNRTSAPNLGLTWCRWQRTATPRPLPRLHRLRSLAGAPGACLLRDLQSQTLRRFWQCGPGHWQLPAQHQQDSSRDDAGRAALAS